MNTQTANGTVTKRVKMCKCWEINVANFLPLKGGTNWYELLQYTNHDSVTDLNFFTSRHTIRQCGWLVDGLLLYVITMICTCGWGGGGRGRGKCIMYTVSVEKPVSKFCLVGLYDMKVYHWGGPWRFLSGWDVDGTGWGSCAIKGFSISGVQDSVYATRELVSKMDLRGVCCEDGRWMELAEDRGRWWSSTRELVS
jgi:hypothetical protein